MAKMKRRSFLTTLAGLLPATWAARLSAKPAAVTELTLTNSLAAPTYEVVATLGDGRIVKWSGLRNGVIDSLKRGDVVTLGLPGRDDLFHGCYIESVLPDHGKGWGATVEDPDDEVADTD